MIISSLQSPSRSLYVIGGNILEILAALKLGSVSPVELYRRYKLEYEDISLSYLMYGLDWLFVVGAVELTETGDVMSCN
ncbi:ABC-three component system middle component 6 [Pseudomonas sp. ZB1P45]|uniref:ABC-three component system middle component 6 n=1 Tax=Pseudomonas frigoris TaxID=3398356 RepID=UPI0039F0AEE0